MAKKGQIFRKYSPEFKISVIMDMREHHLGFRETERKYNIQHSVIAKWERIFLEKGIDGFMRESKDRPPKENEAPKGRPPKLDKKTEEDLITENRRLRMENEYLKKLNALVQERIRRESGKR